MSGELLRLLGVAGDGFATALGTVGTVGPEQWALPTPCDDWDVRALVNHVVGGNVRYTMLLHGASSDDLAGTRGADHLVPDATVAFARTAAETALAFAEDGALGRTVHHPVGDFSGEHLLGMRILELGVHSWDLSRAVGADDVLDPAVVAYLWDWTGALDDETKQRFFAPGSGHEEAGLALQTRLLLRLGRHP